MENRGPPDPYRIIDSVEMAVRKLECFRDEFVRLASTDKQKALADQFATFVDTLAPADLARITQPAFEQAIANDNDPDFFIEF